MAYSLALSSTWILTGLIGAIVLFVLMYLMTRYRRCPSNRILVVYGSTGGTSAMCYHGGGRLVYPLIQDYAYLSLEPLTIEIDLTNALSMQNIRVNVPSTFTIGISTRPAIIQNAAERLLGLTENEVASQASDIILGQMRLVIATLSIEEINQDREKFLELINKNVSTELNKIGLEMINVNIRDITDESGYIEAIGKKAAAEAINKARVEVAEQVKLGAIGEATADREKEVQVADQRAKSNIGQKDAEREQRIRVSEFEAQGIEGEAKASKLQEIAVAEQKAQTVQGRKNAEAEQRIRVAELEASAIEGENMSQAKIADYNAELAKRRAEAQRIGEVATAQAERDVLIAEREREEARLEKEQIVQQNIERKMVEIDAEAEAERRRRIAKGEADAVLAKYMAEAEGIRKVLEAKALGYRELLSVPGTDPKMIPTLLVVEKLPEIIAEQVKAISNLKIDKVTVWDSGQGGANDTTSTAGFLRGMIGSLPPIHELAEQAGVELPDFLGTLMNHGQPVKNVQNEAAQDQDDDTPTKAKRPDSTPEKGKSSEQGQSGKE